VSVVVTTVVTFVIVVLPLTYFSVVVFVSDSDIVDVFVADAASMTPNDKLD
jgi:hypothetical protein